MYDRIYNFSAGPATMPEEVLEEVRDEMMNYRGTGMSVMEMSHRSKAFQRIADEADADLRQLMGIPDHYKILFLQGGATLQFSMIPMNLMREAPPTTSSPALGPRRPVPKPRNTATSAPLASSADQNFTYIPDCSNLPVRENADYVYICENETIHGTTYQQLPNTKGRS